MHISN